MDRDHHCPCQRSSEDCHLRLPLHQRSAMNQGLGLVLKWISLTLLETIIARYRQARCRSPILDNRDRTSKALLCRIMTYSRRTDLDLRDSKRITCREIYPRIAEIIKVTHPRPAVTTPDQIYLAPSHPVNQRLPCCPPHQLFGHGISPMQVQRAAILQITARPECHLLDPEPTRCPGYHTPIWHTSILTRPLHPVVTDDLRSQLLESVPHHRPPCLHLLSSS